MKGLDLVVGAVHSAFDQPRRKQAQRILRALENRRGCGRTGGGALPARIAGGATRQWARECEKSRGLITRMHLRKAQ
jgi:hypothetical protein